MTRIRQVGSAAVPVRDAGAAVAQFLVYVLFTYMAFAAAVHEPWFRDTSYFWRGYPNHPLT